MDRTDNYRKTGELEIDLAGLLTSFFLKWKQIAVCALAGMILLGSFGYLKNRNADMPEETVTEEAELTEEESWNVAEAVQLKKENDAIEEYVENSVLMQTDAYHRESVLLQYCIQEADIHTLPKAVESYTAFLLYGQAAEAVQKSNEPFRKTQAVYLAELITAWQAADRQNEIITDSLQDWKTEKILYVEVSGKDKEMTQQLADAVQKEMEKYASFVKKNCGSHELILLNEINRTRADNTLLAQQREKRSLLKVGRDNLKAMTDAMSEMQKIAYAKDCGIETEEKAEMIAGSDTSSVLKYIVLGLCSGIFAYGCIFVCLYLMRNTVRSESEFQSYYNVPLYGSVSARKTAGKTGQDKAGNRLEQTLGRIRLACKKQGIEKLCLAAEFSAGTKEQAVLEHILQQFQDWGIHAVIGKEPDSDISQWNMLEEAGTVLLVCSIGETTYPMVNHAMEFYCENDIDVMGAVLFDAR